MTQMSAGPRPDFDVVIVGGRPAGATLAARLGARGAKVLVVDRAAFPSLPAVPSSPALYPSAMQLLDELGIPEAGYGEAQGRMDALAVQFHTWFTTLLRVPRMQGRDYVYGVDRRQLDLLLWKNLERLPSVTRREGFSVTGVLRDSGGRVEGVVGKAEGGAEERFRARCVVGADGRHSRIARAVGAAVVEEEAVHVSTVHFANWKGVAPFREGVRCGHVYATCRGLDVLFFQMPGGEVSINTHIRADRADLSRDPQEHYLRVLRSLPEVARRIQGGEQVTPLVGLRRIGNGYREAGGPGWALVGDALHFKDPVDGQGIYDALLEAKLLDEALAPWLAEQRSWDEAMAHYQRRVMEETHPMYLATTARLRRELYSEPPVPVIRTMIRWTMTDPEYQDRFLKYLGRVLSPDQAITPGLMARAILRGVGRDVRSLFRGGRATEERVAGA